MNDETRRDFTEYVEARSAVLFRSAMAITGNRQQAEDILQTALVNCLRHWSKIQRGNPDAYLRRAMYRAHLSWWRRPSNRRERATGESLDAAAGVDQHGRVDTAIALHAALRRLAPRYRAVLVLRYFEDLPDEEIAEILQCTPGTVRSQAARALARLRTLCPDLDTLAMKEAHR